MIYETERKNFDFERSPAALVVRGTAHMSKILREKFDF